MDKAAQQKAQEQEQKARSLAIWKSWHTTIKNAIPILKGVENYTGEEVITVAELFHYLEHQKKELSLLIQKNGGQVDDE